MIKSVEFRRFRNLNQKYEFGSSFNVITGLNNGGKTNFLEGVRLAFSAISGDYFKLSKSDFYDSDDSRPFEVLVELEYNAIPSFNYGGDGDSKYCGFKVKVRKTKSGKYIKELAQYNGVIITRDIILDDTKSLPNVHSVPLYRIEDIYSQGLSVGLSTFIDSEEKYKDIRKDAQEAVKKQIKDKEEKFTNLTSAFASNLHVEVTDPSISNEKLYISDGDKEHNLKIGSGYKSIANMFLCVLDDKVNILLIDEIENHVHPSLLRSLIRELSKIEKLFVISTTHSPVVINETGIETLIDTSVGSLNGLDANVKKKLNLFLHPGRGELIVSENIVLVEGYTEELILNDYIVKNSKNWTVINVAGIMFEPYIRLAHLLNKKIIVISDDDKSNNNDQPTTRFNNLKSLCDELEIGIIQVINTLETDLHSNGFLKDFDGLLRDKPENTKYKVAKSNRKKTEIAQKIIENGIELSLWHAIASIENEFGSN